LILDKRLKKQKDFNLVFNKGKKIYSNSLTLIYLKSEELKFGICVSKKHGKAVLRNRIKRLVRAAFKSFEKNINKNYFIVIIPKVNDDKVYDYHVFLKDLKYLLNKGNITSD
jgi:ribonuclease P protein component